MNTKQFSDKLVALKKADNSAYQANAKSNFVIDYVRKEFIKKAHELATDCSKDVTVELSMTASAIMAPALALLSKDGLYPRLLDKAVQTYENGEIRFTYHINKDALSDIYVDRLKDSLNIAIER